MKTSSIFPMAIGAGVSGGTTAAVRAFTSWDKWASLLGAGAGVLVGGALAIPKKTRSLGLDTIWASAIFSAPTVLSDLLTKPTAKAQKGLIADAAAAIAAGDVAGATEALADAFGVVVADRIGEAVHAGLLGRGTGGNGTDVQVVGGAIQAEPVQGQDDGIQVANVTSMFGSIPIAGVH